MMFAGITVACFVLSYLVVLLLELSRWVFRMPLRMVALVVMTIAGIAAHSLYLWNRFASEVIEQGPHYLLSSWFDWCLVSALGLACLYLILIIRRPETPSGTFILPLLLGLIGVARLVRNQPNFDRSTSIGIWPIVHGFSLMLGVMLVTFGLSISVMYLIQAWKLKHKKNRSGLLRLPSLEYLQSIGRWTLFASIACIGLGLVSGVIMNFQRNSRVVWFEAGILFSGGLFIWLVFASLLQWRFSQRGLGRWTAYLNIGSFGLTLLAFLMVAVVDSHGRTSAPEKSNGTVSEVSLP